MNKHLFLTIGGVLLALAFAASGWFITGRLIESRSNTLLYVSGIARANTPPDRAYTPAANSGDDDGAYDNIEPESILSEQEIISILRNWEARGRETPHEPTADQISMGQAIDIGRDGLLNFYEIGLITSDMLEVSNTTAFLSQNISPMQEGFLDPMYSFWTVIFSSTYQRSIFRVHALTGQIWRYEGFPLASTTATTLSLYQAEAIVEDFLLALALDDLGAAYTDVTAHGISAIRRFAGGDGLAIFTAEGRSLDDSQWVVRRFLLQLMPSRHTIATMYVVR
ncbi:MAG: hypothetical protein FWC75_09025 [Oscillospiraceae bacterium]|nr:hypothetical protein [Oscillospiraceae bacterium]